MRKEGLVSLSGPVLTFPDGNAKSEAACSSGFSTCEEWETVSHRRTYQEYIWQLAGIVSVQSFRSVENLWCKRHAFLSSQQRCLVGLQTNIPQIWPASLGQPT
jgi:hypothetical protein